VNIILISPPPGASAADRGPADNTCSAGCSICGWSGCAGSAAAEVPPRSRLHCGPSSSGNHTTDSYNWSPLLLNRCCWGLLGAENKEQRSVKKKNASSTRSDQEAVLKYLYQQISQSQQCQSRRSITVREEVQHITLLFKVAPLDLVQPPSTNQHVKKSTTTRDHRLSYLGWCWMGWLRGLCGFWTTRGLSLHPLVSPLSPSLCPSPRE